MSEKLVAGTQDLPDEEYDVISRDANTIVPEVGREGSSLLQKSFSGRTLAVFSSGGDSQGMNAAIRAVVRMGLYLGCRVYFIHEGYQGMLDGLIEEATWNSVSSIIQRGGTIIGSARCAGFRERPGRLKACEQLVKRGITNLVCIGGDGSLTGANLFRIEWPSLLEELLSSGRISADKVAACQSLNIVGLVGSIDNDFCGTDMTIGTDSALHRIVEAVDAVASTAQSHQRTFVIEVMGRHCGYLALVAALATEADWVFIPEWPPNLDWPDLMCKKLAKMREQGSRLNIVIVAEGAQDSDGKKITCEQVKTVIQEKLLYDCRVTVLGHVQRGGCPSAFDRLLGTRMGAEAVVALMEMTEKSVPVVISIDGNQMVRVPLMQCVEKTLQVQKAMDAKQWHTAVELRGKSFQRNLRTYKLLAKIHAPAEKDNLSGGHAFVMAIMHIGAPCCGMNAATRAFVRVGLHHNCRVLAIQNSFEGLLKNEVKNMSWTDVSMFAPVGGSILGTQKQLPNEKSLEMVDEGNRDNTSKIALQLEKFNIQGLLLVGGFEAFHSALIMTEAREKYKAFRIPMVVIPATISNNVPGTSFSLGSDTALNEICGMVDKIKQSAIGTKRRVFIIETMGGYCGYLATLSGLASGADNAYIAEEPFNVDKLKEDVDIIAEKMRVGVQRYVVMRNENANANYTTEFIEALYSEEAKGRFREVRNVVRDLYGQAEHGIVFQGFPSPFDRNSATKLGVFATEHLIGLMNKHVTQSCSVIAHTFDSSVLLGIISRKLVFSPLQELKNVTDFDRRLPKDQWWLKVRPLLGILARHVPVVQYETFSVAIQPKEEIELGY